MTDYHRSLNCDALFDCYRQQRKEIISSMFDKPQWFLDNLWGNRSLLYTDNQCACHLGLLNTRHRYVCHGCRDLTRLIDFRDFKVGQPFTVKQCKLVVTAVSQKVDISKDGGLVKCNPATIAILGRWVTSHLLEQEGIPMPEILLTAFVCRNLIVSVTRQPQLHQLTTVGYAIGTGYQELEIRQLLRQLAIYCQLLRPYRYLHRSGLLLLIKQPMSVRIKGHDLKAPFTVIFSDCRDDIVTVGDLVYYSQRLPVDQTSFLSRELVTSKGILRFFSVSADIEPDNPGITVSYTFYRVLAQLVLDPVFYRGITNNPGLASVWQRLWHPSQFNKIGDRLSRLRANQQQRNHLLANLWLQDQIEDTVLNLLAS